MVWKHSQVARVLTFGGLLGVASLCGTCRAFGQEHTGDPYKPYNQEYESYAYPQYPIVPGVVPNQNVLEGRSGTRSANQFQNYVGGLDTVGAEDVYGPRRSGPGVPYYSAYRRYDRDYNRFYQPNQQSDQNFYQDQQARHDKYLAYLRERDPKRRVQLYREYSQTTLRASRDLNATRSNFTRASAAAKNAESAPTARSWPAAPGLGSTGARSATGAATRSGLASPSSPGRSRVPTPSEILRRSRETDSLKSRETITPGSERGAARFPR